MIKTIVNARELRAQIDRDFPISLRPFATDPEVVRDMIARGPDRREAMRPENDRRKADQ